MVFLSVYVSLAYACLGSIPAITFCLVTGKIFGKYLIRSPSALPDFQNFLNFPTLSISDCKFPSSLTAGTPA